jgi:hypothetical protein
MTKEEIHNIYLHMSGKAEGIAEVAGKADFPVLFAEAILEYNRKSWVRLTDEEIEECWDGDLSPYKMQCIREIEAKLKAKNAHHN